MTFEEAVAIDRAGDIRLAARAYEDVLAGDNRSLGVLLNLAVLYWQCTDIGLASAMQLNPSFMASASERFPVLLAEARSRFPDSAEARFWQRYIAWADLGEPFDTDECRQLLREDPATLVPAMYVFAVSNGKESQNEAIELLRRCQADGTTRARYVASVIDGVIKRAGRQR